MPRPDPARLGNLLATGASLLGCPLTDLQISQFLDYLADLKNWNRRMNLTAIRSDQDVIEKHFLDSLAGLKAIEKRPGQVLLDVGTGAGFPGVPLKIGYPELRLTLVEASQKKAAFLHHLCGQLRLSDTIVLNQRIEVLSEANERYDLIVVRAFAKIEVVLDKTMKLLSPKGRLILYQGRPESSDQVRSLNGWQCTIPYELPFSKSHRRLEIFTRPP